MFLNLFISVIFVLVLLFISLLKNKYEKSFNYRVILSLIFGIIFGVILNIFVDTTLMSDSIIFISLFGEAYMRLLSMLVIPIVFLAILTSIINTKDLENASIIVRKILTILVISVAISALVGIFSVYIFNIDETEFLYFNSSDYANITIKSHKAYNEYILDLIPTNIFYAFTGKDDFSTIQIAFLAMFVGYSIIGISKSYDKKVSAFTDFCFSAKEVVMSMLDSVLKFTPYSVFSMVTTFVIKTSLSSLFELAKFICAVIFAIIVMYSIHLLTVLFFRLNPIIFMKKTFPILLFGFMTRSTLSCVPLNISTQINKLGVDEKTAHLSSTFGANIGQNGCTGIYPAMVSMITANVMVSRGYPLTIDVFFILKLIFVVTITSFGIAGIGSDAIFSTISVLTIMGLDLSVITLLIAIDILIDMIRTPLNVSGAVISGVICAKSNNTLDTEIYNKNTWQYGIYVYNDIK